MSAKVPCALVRWWQRLWAPVHQNPDAVLYGEYKGETVLLVPQMCADRPWLVEAWIPDPEFTQVIDRRKEEERRRKEDEERRRKEDEERRRRKEEGDGEDETQADLTGLPAADTPPDLPAAADDPRDLNPAGVGGL